MSQKTVGFIGWRGMVGSVLIERMQAENDFDLNFEPTFFSTSKTAKVGPTIQGNPPFIVDDAFNQEALKKLDIIVSCQGSDYTNTIYPTLRQSGWGGYWIDAASTLRLSTDAVIILDIVNRSVIDQALKAGIKTYVGANCSVSLMLIALSGLFKADWIEWVTTMTYQAASGAGAQHMRELISGMYAIGEAVKEDLVNPAKTILDIDRAVTHRLNQPSFPHTQFGVPLAGSLIPWIDQDLGNGQSKEEWKGMVETNKILGRGPNNAIVVDGLCVRIGAMRCHSQALVIKLRHAISLVEIERTLKEGNDWVRVIPNTKKATLEQLTPQAVSGKLTVPIGRLRQLGMDSTHLCAFTVGDQLLWGAAEPIRRMLKILIDQ